MAGESGFEVGSLITTIRGDIKPLQERLSEAKLMAAQAGREIDASLNYTGFGRMGGQLDALRAVRGGAIKPADIALTETHMQAMRRAGA